ncbi:hypothetical protein MRX96_031174 [Rhipicephalus microplus]
MPRVQVVPWTPRDRLIITFGAGRSFVLKAYLANFFLEEARKNNHSFASAQEELGALIYNYPATFTQKETALAQMYIFN